MWIDRPPTDRSTTGVSHESLCSHPHTHHTALAAPYRLTATVPEKFNLQLRVQSTGVRHGAILTAEARAAEPPVVAVEGKVEGEVEVLVRHGDVRVGKLR